jgi:3-hydroxymyristoyl/3-hydroxydecanoyl-(acyl carrier protein) dehydratase
MNPAVEPPVRAVSTDPARPDEVRIELVVPPTHLFFQGHFPEAPLLPGVVQLTWAVALARHHLPILGEFVGVNALKFMRVIQPNQLVILTLQFDAALCKLHFEYQGDDGLCASGTVRFAIPVASA